MESLPAPLPIPRRPIPSLTPAPTPTESAASTAPPPPGQSTSPIQSSSENSPTASIQREDIDPDHSESLRDSPPPSQEPLTQPSPPPQQHHHQESSDIPKCWICLSDANEDTPNSTPWRSPCPCALVAHEACLLDWIADLEFPAKATTTTTAGPKLLCPQCKSPIHLARPRDVLVTAFQAVERGVAYTFPKAALLIIGGIVYGACAAGGAHTIYAVFGPDEGRRILEPVLRNLLRPPVDAYVGRPREALDRVVGVVMEHLVHWRLYVGLPLITPTLIMSRTSFTDALLPILPVLFFVTQKGIEGGEMFQWPPSAEFAFAVLPYVRGVYNAWYKRLWQKRKQGWLEELQPRVQIENDEVELAQPQTGGRVVEEEEGENVVEIRIEGALFDDYGDEDDDPTFDDEHDLPILDDEHDEPIFDDTHFINNNREQEYLDHEQDLQAARLQEANFQPHDFLEAPAAAALQLPDNRNQQQQQPPAAAVAGNRRNRRINDQEIFLTGVAQTVMGALLFPTLASLAGEGLKFIVPTSWLRGKLPGQRTFLQAKWARTLVGGCLLVVGKDALVLYVRWKMAKMQRERRVLDFVGKKNLG